MQTSETFQIYNPSFPRTGWTGCSSPCSSSHGAMWPLCWLLGGSAACGQGRDTQSPFASGSCLGQFAVVVPPCSMCIQTLPHFPGLGTWQRQERAKDLVCLCSSSLPSVTHGPGTQVSLTLDLLLPSETSNILQKPHLRAGSLVQSGPMFPGGIHMSQTDGMYLISLVPVGFGQLRGLQHSDSLTLIYWCVLPGWAVPQDAGEMLECRHLSEPLPD